MPHDTVPEIEAILDIDRCHIKHEASGIAFTVACFSGYDWSLRVLQRSGDENIHPEYSRMLGEALQSIDGTGPQQIYAPTPTRFNAKVILSSVLRHDAPIMLPCGIPLWRNLEMPADGTFLGPSEAGIFSGGGCGMVVAALDGYVVFAHAGRESLLDREFVLSHGLRRGRPADLIDNMLDALCCTEENAGQCYMWFFYFIRPELFGHRLDDPTHTAYNAAAHVFLPEEFPNSFGYIKNGAIFIDLPQIARAQAMKRGVPRANIDMRNCRLHESAPTTRDTKDPTSRYLAVVLRHH